MAGFNKDMKRGELYFEFVGERFYPSEDPVGFGMGVLLAIISSPLWVPAYLIGKTYALLSKLWAFNGEGEGE